MIYKNYVADNSKNKAKKLITESPKERNLYYKIFCGCIFNELVPINKTKKSLTNKFFNLLEKKCKECGIVSLGESEEKIEDYIENIKSSDETHVDFDHHICHILGFDNSDRGEFADICITDPKSKSLIAIEVKYQSNINYDKDVKNDDNNKDIKNNIGRLNQIKKEGWNVLFAILIKESKWGNMISNKKRIEDYIKNENNNIPLIVFFWEDILEILDTPGKKKKSEVYLYLNEALKNT